MHGDAWQYTCNPELRGLSQRPAWAPGETLPHKQIILVIPGVQLNFSPDLEHSNNFTEWSQLNIRVWELPALKVNGHLRQSSPRWPVIFCPQLWPLPKNLKILNCFFVFWFLHTTQRDHFFGLLLINTFLSCGPHGNSSCSWVSTVPCQHSFRPFLIAVLQKLCRSKGPLIIKPFPES